MCELETELTAILLCGGRGERLRPLTDTVPKALVPVKSQPMLHHLLTYLSASGISRFVVCVGHRAEAVEEFLRQHERPGLNITSINSGEASMTDRVLDSLCHIKGRAIVCYGDTLADVDLCALLQQHLKTRALATLTTYPMHSPFGIVQFDDAGRVRSFAEKPILPYWINIGFLVCEPDAFGFLRRGTDMIDFISALTDAGGLYTYRHLGKHMTINTAIEWAEADGHDAFLTGNALKDYLKNTDEK